MNVTDVAYLPETPAHDQAIEIINAEAFGPGRYARAAYKIREGGPHDLSLSFVAVIGDEIVGSVRMTPVAAGEGRALLLGPLAVRPAHKNVGIGRKLVRIAVDATEKASHALVLLVGDAPYYGPLGFNRVPAGQIIMPRPVDPHRMLANEIVPGSLALLRGKIVHAQRAEPVG